MGCGMIHPNVLKQADIDPDVYSGFAWGFGVDRLTMIKKGINDIRLLRDSNLNFLKQF
jgi:phenylalanyl-tRNA synthetase alpha chain